MNHKTNTGLFQYLESLGILETGTEEEIAEAKKAYRKNYLLDYKRKQRARQPEFNVHFSNENGDFYKVKKGAEKHHCTITTFIHDATLFYIEQKFIVPDKLQVLQIEQMIADCLNEIQTITKYRERYHYERDQKLESIEKLIVRLEQQIDNVFRHPPLQSASTDDYQNKVA